MYIKCLYILQSIIILCMTFSLRLFLPNYLYFVQSLNGRRRFPEGFLAGNVIRIQLILVNVFENVLPPPQKYRLVIEKRWNQDSSHRQLIPQLRWLPQIVRAHWKYTDNSRMFRFSEEKKQFHHWILDQLVKFYYGNDSISGRFHFPDTLR